jgi:hypothetical protein
VYQQGTAREVAGREAEEVMDDKTPLGPNVKRLLMERCSQLMVDRAGSAEGGKVCAVAARLAENNGVNLKADMREAFAWVCEVMRVVRSSPDNPYKTDEEIAGELMRRIDAKRKPIHA